ncbi:MAG: 5-(carboxyamino)imidazole ribonucleotide synthase [Gammaproteobacteria bacterium]|nr:5-(carboxyamino)imidazole ribonucleotide synthase [Gammaproteobacteria bacterium]
MTGTVGILGAGQLARMLAQAGKPMGLDFIFLDPAEDACAAEYGEHICAAWDDEAALKKLGRQSDVVTFDFENVPEASASLIESLCPVYPPPRALYKSQDRLREKTMMQDLGIPVAPFHAVSSRPELKAAVEQIGLPCVLKTRRFGYDGKGQAVLRFEEDLERVWQDLGDSDLICEGFVPFDAECSIIAARGLDGRTVYWPLTRNLHRDGVLAASVAPFFDGGLQAKAEALVQRLLDHLDYTGVLALELFLKDGELLANEFAPRVHNSGHWSIDGARSSQFDNHLRAICGLPLGDAGHTSHSLMFNLLGEMPSMAKRRMSTPQSEPDVHWHDYQKTPRAGRKIGHVTVTAETEGGLRATAAQLAGKLGVTAELNLEAVMQDVSTP